MLAAGDADGEGVVDYACVDGVAGDALTVPRGWALATPSRGSPGCCWPVHRSWRCWPPPVSGHLLATPGVVDANGVAGVVPVRALWVVLLRLLSMMLWVAVPEVALLLVLLLMPVVRALQVMLRF